MASEFPLPFIYEKIFQENISNLSDYSFLTMRNVHPLFRKIYPASKALSRIL